jgi:polysaccharide export outer membrane protein
VVFVFLFLQANLVCAQSQEEKPVESTPAVVTQQSVVVPENAPQTAPTPALNQPPVGQQTAQAIIQPVNTVFDPLTYTLGPDDAVEISVMRHPEFSGVYPINQEGKLQYKFVGDLDVNGFTKLQLENKVKEAISPFVNSPEVNVTVTEYRSKVFYVLGEVGAPGKYYMRSDKIPVREAVFEAGLPSASAAMRKCRIITPDKSGRAKTRKVDLYAVLYGGNLRKNIDMRPGDVLYVPSTVMAKVGRVINPVTSTMGIAASGPGSASSGRTAVETLQGRPR